MSKISNLKEAGLQLLGGEYVYVDKLHCTANAQGQVGTYFSPLYYTKPFAIAMLSHVKLSYVSHYQIQHTQKGLMTHANMV